jgi:hypothetical protein
VLLSGKDDVFGENPCIYDTIGKKQEALLHIHTHTVVHNYFTTSQEYIGTEQRDFLPLICPCINFPSKPHTLYTVSRASCIWQNENGSCEAGPNSKCW